MPWRRPASDRAKACFRVLCNGCKKPAGKFRWKEADAVADSRTAPGWQHGFCPECVAKGRRPEPYRSSLSNHYAGD